MDKLFIVMPAYNEADNIREVIKEWYPVLEGKSEDSKLVIADGGSTDDTLNILYEMQKEYPKLEVFSKPGTDHGTKLIFLYKYAISENADYIFQTDSDGQTLPEEFEEFWKMRNDYEGIFGNRSEREDGKSRVFVENVLRLFLKVFFGISTPDANAPFRLMKTSTVQKYIGMLPDDFNLPNAMLVTYFHYYKERVAYKKVTFRPRQGGVNYINPKRILRIGFQSIKNFYVLRKNLKRK